MLQRESQSATRQFEELKSKSLRETAKEEPVAVHNFSELSRRKAFILGTRVSDGNDGPLGTVHTVEKVLNVSGQAV